VTLRFTSIARHHSTVWACHNGPTGPLMPALLMRMSAVPSRSRSSVTAAAVAWPPRPRTGFPARSAPGPPGGGHRPVHRRGYRARAPPPGIQTALLSARLAGAAAAGCDIAVVTTQPGSKSQQNGQRRGFDLLHTRAVLVTQP
jgi:hypothetical protein